MENEKRLIEANALIEKKRQVCCGHGEYDYMVELYHIENAPTVDAVEVVYCENCVSHGHCLTEDTFRIARIDNPYCCGGKQKTNCGAKMDGGNEDA